MTTFPTRSFHNDDATPIAAALNAEEVEFGGDPFWSEVEIRDMATGWIRDAATDSRVVTTSEGQLVAMAMVTPAPDGGVLSDTFAAVHPDWVGRGIGRELLAWEFDRLRALRDECAPGVAWSIDVGANVKNQRAVRLFERSGMAPVRYFFEMVADIAAVPEARIPDGFRIVGYQPEMAEALYAADDEAFADHWGHESHPIQQWRSITVDSDLFRPEHSRIAFDGDEIAAYVLAYDDAVGYHYIGQVGTRQPWRKRGLASGLIAATARAAAADGKTVACLGVDADNPTGALGVYERLGFVARQRYVVYRSPLE
jgi:mycothiol synthase